MSAQLLSSKTVIEEEAPTIRVIQGVATGVLAAIGLAQRGPIGVATLCLSWEAFVKTFGGDIGAAYAPLAIRGFFAGGGERLYFTRVVHYSDITNPESNTSARGTFDLQTALAAPSAGGVTGAVVGPFALTHGDTLTLSRDGGSNATATINATRAAVTAANAGPYALSNNQTLQVKVDGGPTQTISFGAGAFANIGAATATEVLAVINAALDGGYADLDTNKPRVNSDTQGTNSHIEIVGGTANGAFGFSTTVANGSGNVADVLSVSIAELKAIIEAAVSGTTVSSAGGALRIVSNTTGGSSSIQVNASSTADDELGLDNAPHAGGAGGSVATLRIDAKYDGSYSSDVTVTVTPATSGAAAEFNLLVLFRGSPVNRFPNLSMDPASPRYVETIVNADADDGGSEYIQVTDLEASPTASVKRPANSPGSPAVAFGPLAGGGDGLVGLADIDFVGDSSSRLGLNSFDLKDDIDVLISPDRATPAVHNALLSYASVTRNGEVFAILDPPAGLSPEGVVSYVDNTAAIVNLTEDGAIYWPRIRVLNPNASVYGPSESIVVPPSGHIAGMYARTDGSKVGGIYEPPGGVEKGTLPGCVGLENDEVLDENVRDLIAPRRINPITKHRGHPIAADDVMTLKRDGAFPTIAERRGVSFIERSIKDGTQFARIRNNDEALRDEINRTCETFLLAQMRVGAFRSKDPEKAFFVDTGDAINPESEAFAGKVWTRIGLATNKPSRFLIYKFSQDTRALDEELAAANG